ncbi:MULTISPECIES: ATP-binding protein [Bacteroidales]|uniref:nSTAND3 domain-containing NTPase n=1 Tax=Bacteroidales TaxID=171549 RepID=UPI0025580706|nr:MULTISPECIES: ATP-binding protein [Bacteroidales]
MSKIAEIENTLSQMNPARFQELGDILITRIYPNAAIFACVGSQFGKEKTTAGTPDTYIRTGHKAIFVEYTTNVSSGIAKIEDDINKCLSDINVSGFTNKSLIIIFANFKISKEDQTYIVDYAKSKGHKCHVYDGQRIARLLFSNHKDLVMFCGVPIDTGQVVGVDIFLKEYAKKGGQFAIPLSTKFMFRENELAGINEHLKTCDIVLITGAPGVGKTSIAIEAIRNYCQSEKYYSKCISYKEASLLSDLNSNLVNGEDYVILVDDVNRVKNVGQIIGFQNSCRDGKIKLVLTVRNYAKDKIYDILADTSFETVDIDRMSDENIIELVKLNRGINNDEYLKKIASIACGNPRLAMMAATVAIKEQTLSSLSNLGKLFDSFYSNLFKKNTTHEDRLLYNALAIASILGPFSIENQLLPSLYSIFDICSEEFQKAINRWVEMEYIDQYSNGYYKIAEQNMGPYIFYSYIVKKRPELIEKIFNICFDKQDRTLRENIITCSYLFGLNDLRNRISAYVSNIFASMQGDEKKIVFLNSYWPLILSDALAYIASEIYSIELPHEGTESYSLEYAVNEFSYSSNRDPLLNLISGIFDYAIEELGDVIQMALEYIRRRPDLAPQLVWSINEHFGFTPEDHKYGFVRQIILLDTISTSMNTGDYLTRILFWKIIGVLLKCEHHCVKGAFRNPQKFVIYNLSIRESKPLIELHKKIWALMDCYFDKESFSSFIGNHGFYAPKGSRFPKLDAYSVIEIINKHLSPNDFEDCLIVEKFINSIRYIRSCNQLKSSLLKRFNNSTYEFYNLLRWNYCKGKEEVDYDYQNYNPFKVKELTTVFQFENKKECDAFICKFKSLITNRKLNNKEPLYRSVSFLIGHILRKDICLGSYFFKLILRCTAGSFNLGQMLYPLAYDDKHNWAHELCAIKNILRRSRNQYKYKLLIEYYAIVPGAYLVSNDLTILLKSIRSYKSSDRLYISPSQFTKFNEISKDGFTVVMRELYLANHSEIMFHFGCYEAETWFELITDRNLAESIYLQQVGCQDHFDYKRKAFLNIVKSRPYFLIDYVKVAKPQGSPKINEVWAVTDIEPIIEEILLMIRFSHNLWRGISQEWEYELFSEIKNQDNLKKVEKFIIARFWRNENIEQTFRLAHLFSHQLFNQLALDYIDCAISSEEYMEIDWINSSPCITAVNQTVGDIIACRWQNFLEVVQMSKSHKKYPIITRIQQLIQRAQDSSREENEREKLFR